jgi:glutathione S-transferase
LPDGAVLAESLAIMRWALAQADPGGWLQGWSSAEQALIESLLAENDGPFKHHLDRFKYPDRYPGGASAEHRLAALAILRRWSARLEGGSWLLGDRPALVDWALLPFVRQFCLADREGFDQETDLEPLQRWLARFLADPALTAVMDPPWAERSAWRSPRWLYHLALRAEWNSARSEGSYRRSTRGRTLEEVGFIHLSAAHQVEATAQRFYGDLPPGEVVLLSIDPQRLAAAGIELRTEPAPGTGELFPHLYGALPLEAVLLVQPFTA